MHACIMGHRGGRMGVFDWLIVGRSSINGIHRRMRVTRGSRRDEDGHLCVCAVVVSVFCVCVCVHVCVGWGSHACVPLPTLQQLLLVTIR